MSEKESYVPSHPGLFEVDFKPGNYCSVLIACKVWSWEYDIVWIPDNSTLIGLRGGEGHRSFDRSDKRASVVCNPAMWSRARRPSLSEF